MGDVARRVDAVIAAARAWRDSRSLVEQVNEDVEEFALREALVDLDAAETRGGPPVPDGGTWAAIHPVDGSVIPSTDDPGYGAYLDRQVAAASAAGVKDGAPPADDATAAIEAAIGDPAVDSALGRVADAVFEVFQMGVVAGQGLKGPGGGVGVMARALAAQGWSPPGGRDDGRYEAGVAVGRAEAAEEIATEIERVDQVFTPEGAGDLSLVRQWCAGVARDRAVSSSEPGPPDPGLAG